MAREDVQSIAGGCNLPGIPASGLEQTGVNVTSKEIMNAMAVRWENTDERHDGKALEEYRWCIEWKENQQIIGVIGATKFEEDKKSAELFCRIEADYWGQGITAEAVTKVTGYFFDKVGCKSVMTRYIM